MTRTLKSLGVLSLMLLLASCRLTPDAKPFLGRIGDAALSSLVRIAAPDAPAIQPPVGPAQQRDLTSAPARERVEVRMPLPASRKLADLIGQAPGVRKTLLRTRVLRLSQSSPLVATLAPSREAPHSIRRESGPCNAKPIAGTFSSPAS